MNICSLIELIEEKERMIQESQGKAQDRHYKDLEKLQLDLENAMRKSRITK